MCSGSAAIPRGRVESRPGLRVAGTRFPPCAGEGGLPAVLTEAAGETVHLAGKAPGSRLSGAGTSFSGPTRVSDAEPDPLAFSSARLGSHLPPPSSVRPPRGSQPRTPGPLPRQVESRAAPLRRLPGLPPRQQPRAPRRAPPPRPRAAVAPPPRTPSRFRLRLPRDDPEAGSCRPFPLTLPRPRVPPPALGRGGYACAMGLLRAWDLGLETASEWVGIRGDLRHGILRSF